MGHHLGRGCRVGHGSILPGTCDAENTAKDFGRSTRRKGSNLDHPSCVKVCKQVTAGDQHPMSTLGRQQPPHLRGIRGVVGHDQQTPSPSRQITHHRPVAGLPVRLTGRNLRARDSELPQQAIQRRRPRHPGGAVEGVTVQGHEQGSVEPSEISYSAARGQRKGSLSRAGEPRQNTGRTRGRGSKRRVEQIQDIGKFRIPCRHNANRRKQVRKRAPSTVLEDLIDGHIFCLKYSLGASAIEFIHHTRHIFVVHRRATSPK